ncbi:MAG TPA: hypothetical protein VKC34_03715 [Blastocatellia bacterium]|nr:hypothetical protein [Blastocatellia bacterium]
MSESAEVINGQGALAAMCQMVADGLKLLGLQGFIDVRGRLLGTQMRAREEGRRRVLVVCKELGAKGKESRVGVESGLNEGAASSTAVEVIGDGQQVGKAELMAAEILDLIMSQVFDQFY